VAPAGQVTPAVVVDAGPPPAAAPPPEAATTIAAEGTGTTLSLKLVATLAGSVTENDVSPNGDAVICAGRDGELAVRILATGVERPALRAGDEILAIQRGTFLVKRGGKLVAGRAFDDTAIAGRQPPSSDSEAVSVSEDGTRYAVMNGLASGKNGLMRAKLTVFDTKTNSVIGSDTWGWSAAGGMIEGLLAPSGTAVLWSHSRGPSIERSLASKTDKSLSDTQSRFATFADGLRVRTPENPGFFAPKDLRVWIEQNGKRTVLFTRDPDTLSPRVAYADGLKLLLLNSTNGDMNGQTLRVFDTTTAKEVGRFALPGGANVVHARGGAVLVALEEKDKTPLYRLVR